jgi:hypothetical protein
VLTELLKLELTLFENEELELEVELGNSPPLHAPSIKADAISEVALNLFENLMNPPRINNLINLLYKTIGD